MVGDQVVTQHITSEQLQGGVLLCRGKLCQAGGMRRGMQAGALRQIARLAHPASELETTG